MDWSIPLIGFSLAVLTGAALASLLVQLKPDWSSRRRLLTAAALLPAITVVATLLGIAFVVTADHGQGENMQDLAVAAIAAIGAAFTLLAFGGGALGAALAQRRRQN